MCSKSLFPAIAFVAVAACGGSETPQARPIAHPAPPAPYAHAENVAPTPPPPSTKVYPDHPGSVTDERIAGIRNAMDEGLITQARLAEQKGSDPRVKDFAAEIIAEQSSASERQAELLDRLDLTPVESPGSASVREEDKRTLERLEAANGASFDQAFLDAQVVQNHRMIAKIHDELIPAAQSEDLKADLVSLIPQASDNVEEVFEIRRDIAGRVEPSPNAGPGMSR